MKKEKTKESEIDDILPEYDLTGKKGVRGKYYRAYRQGHQVRIYKEDGTVTIQYFTLEDGAVMLEPDVRKYFPDSEAVNNALRSLIALIPRKSAKRSGKKVNYHDSRIDRPQS
jgi:hypothetical protein